MYEAGILTRLFYITIGFYSISEMNSQFIASVLYDMHFFSL